MRVTIIFQSAIVLWTGSSLVATQAIADIGGIDWDDENWIIQTHTLDQGHYQSRMSLANGYLGINVAALGPFFEIDEPVVGNNNNGWPLFNTRQTFATIAGFYDADDSDGGTNYPWLGQYGGDSFLSGIPHWAGLVVKANGTMLNASTDAEQISDFTSSLDIGGGIMGWAFTWRPGNAAVIKIEYQMFVHKLYVNQAAIQLKLTSSRDVDVTVYDVVDGTSAVRADFVDKKFETGTSTIWSAVSPKHMPDTIAYVVSTLECDEEIDLDTRAEVVEEIFGSVHASSISQSVNIELVGGKTIEVNKFVGVASSDAFQDPKSVATAASISGASGDFYAQRGAHIKEWNSILTKDSVDSYDYPNGSLPLDKRLRELQVTSIMNPFMILQNTVGLNAIKAAGYNTRLNRNSIPVCGLGSDCYGGLIFWDAETWMALGLQLSHPKHIENVVNYRVDLYPQAKENVKTAYRSSKNQTNRFTGGAVYPWTSGRYGNCTASGPCFDYEYHVNGDIGISFRNYYIITGDAKRFKDEFLPISNDIAYFYSEMLDFNTTSGYYEVWNATDPDEYANNVNNVAFTTALIQRHLNETNELNTLFGFPQNESWNQQSARMRLPVHEDAGIVLEYASMNGSIVVKQADIVLIDDVLNYENPYSLVDLDYYANKQSSDGPGMTYASFSIVANEISPSGCSSYTYDLYSSQPYARAPWFQYSEQIVDNARLNGGTNPGFPFLTGMGGANRIGIFGYLGLRMFVDRLDIDPSLPPQMPHLNYRTFYWQGYGINATSNVTHTTLNRIEDKILDTANEAYYDAPIPVTLGTRSGKFWLGNETLVVENRMLGQTKTMKGNILQCKPIVSPKGQSHMPGQFLMAAVDGASSTKWQPENSTRINYLTVDLGDDHAFAPVHRILFDWGSKPPVYYEVLFTNISIPPFEDDPYNANKMIDIRNVTSGIVKASEPYDPDRAIVIEPVKGNQTNITLVGDERVWSGRYAHLGIQGTLGNNGDSAGGTVAEWSVILEDRDHQGDGHELAESEDEKSDHDADELGNGAFADKVLGPKLSLWVQKPWRR